MDFIQSHLTSFNHQKNISLKSVSTFKIGGNAKYLFLPLQRSELIQLIKYFDEKQICFLLFGRASNILFSDEMKTDFLISTKFLNKLTIIDKHVTVEAGFPLRELCYRCAEVGLTGLEGLSGIPGTVGGGVYMNAGAYGFTISDYLTDVTVFDRKQQKIITYSKKACGFGYRRSRFTDRNQIILFMKMKLKSGDKEHILQQMRSYELNRSQKQPLNYPSAGSVFKKPTCEFHPALEIEKLGLKGYTIGGACVSQKHSGFIINKNHATAMDVKKLINYLKQQILKKTNVLLETEIDFFE